MIVDPEKENMENHTEWLNLLTKSDISSFISHLIGQARFPSLFIYLFFFTTYWYFSTCIAPHLTAHHMQYFWPFFFLIRRLNEWYPF